MKMVFRGFILISIFFVSFLFFFFKIDRFENNHTYSEKNITGYENKGEVKENGLTRKKAIEIAKSMFKDNNFKTITTNFWHHNGRPSWRIQFNLKGYFKCVELYADNGEVIAYNNVPNDELVNSYEIIKPKYRIKDTEKYKEEINNINEFIKMGKIGMTLEDFELYKFTSKLYGEYIAINKSENGYKYEFLYSIDKNQLVEFWGFEEAQVNPFDMQD